MMRITILLLLLMPTLSYGQTDNDTGFAVLPGELWWGGPVSYGHSMPYGKEPVAFELNGDGSYNQSTPLMLSNKGRWVWSEQPYKCLFYNGNITIDHTQGKIYTGRSGNTLQDAYSYVSKRFFPVKGKWPDSLLITAPQYNLWIELMYHPNQKDVLGYAEKVVSNELPPGVLMIDDNWSDYYGKFDFDKDKFPNAKALIATLHLMGFKVMLWICPFISPDSKEYRELAEKKLLLLDNEGNTQLSWEAAKKPLIIEWWNGHSACLDLTNPDAEKWLKSKLDYLQKEYYVDGFKMDAGDAYFYTSERLVSYKNVLPNEHTLCWAKVGLDYPLNEYRAMWKMGGQPLVQRLADKSHSWEDLQKLIPQTIAQQLSGYTFTCPDMIGGGSFTSFLPGKKVDQKLIVRSAQCHALMPMMQFSAAPWRILDSTHFMAVKQAVDIRQQYLPYIIRALENAAATGMPAVKSLEFNYPGQGYEYIKDQFLLGDSLMVAPVLTTSDTREVIIPKGEWTYKNTAYSGPAKITITARLDELPVFKLVH